MTFFIMGDSHCTAVKRAAQLEEGCHSIDGGMIEGAWAFYRPFFNASNAGFSFIYEDMSLALARHMDRATDPTLHGRTVVSLGLSSEAMLGVLAKENFDFQPGYAGSDRHFLSHQAVDRLIEVSQANILEFYRCLHSLGYLKAAIAGPAIQRRHRIFQYYGDRAILLRARFERPVRTFLAEIGCPIIEPPETIDGDGFLIGEYWGDDWSHANAAFGRLVIQRLEAHSFGQI
jgi:hypothetical protein